MGVLRRNNVCLMGSGPQAVAFLHGFGCDQNMWRFVVPAFQDRYRVLLLDLVGAGGSDISAYNRTKYGTLEGYASDLLEVCAELDLSRVIFVGHSVSSMIGVLAANKRPELFERLVLVGPSPRYVDDVDYVGGFQLSDIEEMLDVLDDNYLGWASDMAPVIMGNPERPELGQELTNSFCRTDPEIARHFARVTFLSDNRLDLPRVTVRSLIMQCANDPIAPQCVGEYTHKNIAGSELLLMQATGHCPNLSAPRETIAGIQGFLGR
jgi:sigma-B regulation protein RsbQ